MRLLSILLLCGLLAACGTTTTVTSSSTDDASTTTRSAEPASTEQSAPDKSGEPTGDPGSRAIQRVEPAQMMQQPAVKKKQSGQ